MPVVTLLYYALVAFVSALLVANLKRSRKWERDVLYVLVLIPFLLRLLRLK
jgi:ABC-type spermidine/putrescine transport system permease subunit I